jgi:hypothetical protein
MHPEISYSHVMLELSENRLDPCEIIRELISNSYDAKASIINIYPLLEAEGFIYFDNGCGMSETETINDITPYKAFFSIGRSTKTFGETIGYKCQGSKLCFASNALALITRCQGEEYWRSKSIDNPWKNLTDKYDIASKVDKSPWETLKKLFIHPDNLTTAILAHLNHNFFQEQFRKGTMIIIQGLRIENFSYYYGVNGSTENKAYSYLNNYIRFNTKHGDVRILHPEKTGFSPSKAKDIQHFPDYNEKTSLAIWSNGQLDNIEAGYPYLEKPSEQDKPQIKTPAKVSQLRHGSFFAREVKTFRHDDITYILILAIDGNRRALEKYDQLDRQGKKGKRSGIRLTDQRGTFICAHGVKICQYNEILNAMGMEDYAILTSAKAQAHYVFMINGKL